MEVLTGGFATGEFLAAGPLQRHEQTLLAQLSAATELANPRHALNVYYLTDAGISRLQELLGSSEYEVSVPEEGALLVVAWLLKHGHNETARELLAKIGPYVSQLRFYPAPRTFPRFSDSRVFVEDVGSTIGRLRNIKPNAQILAQKEAIEIWTPLYDRVVALFLETIEKEPAKLAAGPPAGWHERARLLLNEVDDAARTASHSRKHTRKKENFAQLISFLRKWVDPRRDRDDKEVKRVRELLGLRVEAWGARLQPVAPCANGNPSNARGQHSMRSRASSSTGSGNIHRRPALRTLRRWSNPWTTRKRRCRRQSYEKSCAAFWKTLTC